MKILLELKMELENKKLRLPKTDFPMRSGLPILENKIKDFWKNNEIREKIRNKRKNSVEKILHFGPPYANGEFHMGHGLTYILKSIIVRSFNLQNYNINNLTGHDCHGLPIELATKKILKNQPENLNIFLKECNKLANTFIEKHENEFDRMGVLRDPGYYATQDSVKEIYEVFSKLLRKNLVYLDKKPCPWSITEKTVVSDAEIEHRTKKTKTVDIALEILESPIENLNGKFICVWTTTPWTLIDNVAVAYNKNHNYLICEVDNKILLIGEKTQEEFESRTGIVLNVVAQVSGEIFANTKCKHPILETIVPMLHGDFVEDNSGTGFVHLAPAHGLEDFELCAKHNIEVVESVDDSGFYNLDVPHLGGKHIFINEEDIFDLLEGKLLQISTIEHEYPFDTRGGNIVEDGKVVIQGTPLIYRATEQLFIDIHKINFENLTKDLMNLETRPEFLKKSILDHVLSRKEWCVSRNRVLGVPAAVFKNIETDELLINEKLQEKILEKIAIDPSYFLKDNCIEILNGIVQNPDKYEPKFYVLDVWFDSGCVAYFLSKYFNKNAEFQVADVYAEGKDQVRGWFQSSLLLSYLLEEKLPYKAIVSHGHVVDEDGYKMSKSKGNVLSLMETMEKYGVEILYIWVMSSDYTNDVAYGPKLIEKSSEVYRKIRNVMRFLISVVENEEIDLEFKNFEYLEQAILNEMIEMQENYIKNLQTYSLRKAFDSIFLFLNRISELYFNARKDTLYCDSIESKSRQSSINCIGILLRNLMILLTPLLPFTSEEIFQYIKEKFGEKMNLNQSTSVHELSIEDCFKIKFDNSQIKSQILSLESLIEKIRKEIENLKQTGEITRNSDVRIQIKENISTPLDVLADLTGVLSIELNNNLENEFKIEISQDNLCSRCNRKCAKENLCLKTLCLRCDLILKN